MRKIALSAAPLLLAMSTSAVAAEAGWRLSEVSGDVRVISSGGARPATRGALLASGSTIVAGARSKAVIVRNKDVVVVSANSRIRLVPTEQQKGFFQIISEFGTSLFTIEHKKQPHFGVQTPYLAAVVKGTVFSVTVTASGASVQVTQGAVDVATLDGGAHELIRPGMIGSVGAGDRYQLRVDGDGNRVVRSDNAPAGTVGVAAPAPGPSQAAAGEPPEGAPPLEVTDAIDTGSVSVAEATGGLIQGTTGLDLAMAAAGTAESARREDKGAGGGSAAGSGNAAGGHDTPGSGSDAAAGGGGNAGGSKSDDQGGKGDDGKAGKGDDAAGGSKADDKGGQSDDGKGGKGDDNAGGSKADDKGGQSGGGKGGKDDDNAGGPKADDKGGQAGDGKDGKDDDGKTGKDGGDKGDKGGNGDDVKTGKDDGKGGDTGGDTGRDKGGKGDDGGDRGAKGGKGAE